METPTITLADGGVLRIHPLAARDLELFIAFVESLSLETRYRRFFQPLPVVGPHFARPLCDIDQVGHLGWLLFDAGTPVAELRAVASHENRGEAEVAVAVADSHRRRGIASSGLRCLGVAAAETGIERFTASVMADNRASASLMDSIGLPMRFEDGELRGSGPIPTWSGHPSEAAAVRAMQRRIVGDRVAVAA